MRNSIKGALLSGLVFPGSGQIVQKNYIRGTALILVVSWCMFQMMVKMLKQVNELFEQIKSANIAISSDDIFSVVIKLMPDIDGPSYQALMLVMAGCWAVSVVDAWLVGQKIDAEVRSAGTDLTDLIELEQVDQSPKKQAHEE